MVSFVDKIKRALNNTCRPSKIFISNGKIQREKVENKKKNEKEGLKRAISFVNSLIKNKKKTSKLNDKKISDYKEKTEKKQEK